MRSAAMSDPMGAVNPSMTRCQHLALKGPHEIAQGYALGCATLHRMSPERAKSETVQSAHGAGRRSSCAIPPFQGGNRPGIGFPGLRLGLSYLAPSGPDVERGLELMPLCESWEDGGYTTLRRIGQPILAEGGR